MSEQGTSGDAQDRRRDGPADELREAWGAFCDALHREGERVLDGDSAQPANDQELAEALRAVARMGTMALQHRMDFCDPDFPLFFRALDDRYKYAGPDAFITYLSAPVRGTGTYRIRAEHHGREFNLGPIWASRLANGGAAPVEIVASADEQPGNWIPLDRDKVSGEEIPEQYPMAHGDIGGRVYYWDPEDERPAGRFTIDRVDDDRPEYPEPLSSERLAAQLGSAGALLSAMAPWWLARAERIREQNPANVVGPPGTAPPGVTGWTVPPQSPLNYGVCAWDLGEDEALYLESAIPDCAYWSFQVYTPWWESPDVQNRQTSIGHTEAHLDEDGRFRAVIAHRDPGCPNWLDTGGHRRGFLFYRWLHAERLEQAVGEVIAHGEIRSRLPAGHPTISPAERADRIAARRAWIASRFQLG